MSLGIIDGTCLCYGFKDVSLLLQKTIKGNTAHRHTHGKHCAQRSNHPVSCLSLQRKTSRGNFATIWQRIYQTLSMYIIRYI